MAVSHIIVVTNIINGKSAHSGKIPVSLILEIERLSKNISAEIKLLLISKSSIDASGKKEGSSFARAEKSMIKNGFSIFVLTRPKDGQFRAFSWAGGSIDLILTERGFIQT